MNHSHKATVICFGETVASRLLWLEAGIGTVLIPMQCHATACHLLHLVGRLTAERTLSIILGLVKYKPPIVYFEYCKRRQNIILDVRWCIAKRTVQEPWNYLWNNSKMLVSDLVLFIDNSSRQLEMLSDTCKLRWSTFRDDIWQEVPTLIMLNR